MCACADACVPQGMGSHQTVGIKELRFSDKITDRNKEKKGYKMKRDKQNDSGPTKITINQIPLVFNKLLHDYD